MPRRRAPRIDLIDLLDDIAADFTAHMREEIERLYARSGGGGPRDPIAGGGPEPDLPLPPRARRVEPPPGWAPRGPNGTVRSRADDKRTAAARILGVQPDAPREVIEAAHKALSLKHHPDHGGSTDRMAEINRARDTLVGT